MIGGGPAGLAAGIAFAQSGYSAAVVDRATPPIDKVCGEGLMPDSIAALRELGISVPVDCGFRFRGVRFLDARSSVVAPFPNGHGLGLRRKVLHELLVHRAKELGIALLWGVKQVHVAEQAVSIDGRLLRCAFAVGADGQNSAMRREAGLNGITSERRRYGFRRHYRVAPWSQNLELYWGPRGQIYVTPVNPQEVCIALLSRDPALRLNEALHDFPELQARLEGASHASREQGAVSATRTLARVCRNNLALVGDASGSVDAVTGEGMCLAFRQSLALADAFRRRGLQDYEAQHAALSKRPKAMARLMLTLDTYAGFQRRALASLSERQDVFAALLAIHVGERSFADLMTCKVVRLCRAFLVA